MVQFNLMLSVPVRVVCVQCKQDLKLKWAAQGKPECVLKCPACGFEVRMAQGAEPQPLPGLGPRLPKFQVQPKT